MPKTASALRQVDLHPSLAALVKAHVGQRTSGLLFRTASGKPISQTNILKRSLVGLVNFPLKVWRKNPLLHEMHEKK